MPNDRKRRNSRPYGVSKRVSPRASRIAALSSLVVSGSEVSCCASSAQSRWVKLTTYTGARPPVTRSYTVSWSGVSRHSNSSGTGLVVELTTAASTPVASSRRRAIPDMSPSVADISRKRACGSVTSGTCQAQPRSRSA